VLLGTPRSGSTLVVTRAPEGPDAGRTALVAVRRGWRGGAPLESADVELPGGRRVTWITVRSFAVGVTELLGERALGDVVVDLRGNPGGEMSEGVRFLDRFVTEGVLLQSAVRGEPAKTWTARNEGNELGERLVVLVDAGTASAAEIVAGGLQARRSARVIGQPTVGKRSIQTVLRYEDGSAMQLTIGSFTPASDPVRVDVGLVPGDAAAWRSAAAATLAR
jgi:carboxyl-terminal processing protease